MCQRCEELEAEVAYLKGELGIAATEGEVAAIRSRLRLTDREARMVLHLYHARPRGVSRWMLSETHFPDVKAEVSNSPSVHVWRIRQALGTDFIETLPRFGYRLSAVGQARVYQVLKPGAVAA